MYATFQLGYQGPQEQYCLTPEEDTDHKFILSTLFEDRFILFDKLSCFSICIFWDLWCMWTRNPLVNKQANLPKKTANAFFFKVYHYYFYVCAPCFKIHTQGWSGGSGVKTTGWFSKGPSFKSQNPYRGSKVTHMHYPRWPEEGIRSPVPGVTDA